VALETLRRFERTGKIAVERLVRIAVVLDAVGPLGNLFSPSPAKTLKDLERAERPRRRASKRRRTPGDESLIGLGIRDSRRT
jgi:hypothetical protein